MTNIGMDSEKFGNHYKNLGFGTAGSRVVKSNQGIDQEGYYRNQLGSGSSANKGNVGRHGNNPTLASKNMNHMKK